MIINKDALFKYIYFIIFAFIVLHTPNGKPVFVNTESINFIGPPADSESNKACSRVLIYGIWQWIKECPEDIKRAIDNASRHESDS